MSDADNFIRKGPLRIAIDQLSKEKPNVFKPLRRSSAILNMLKACIRDSFVSCFCMFLYWQGKSVNLYPYIRVILGLNNREDKDIFTNVLIRHLCDLGVLKNYEKISSSSVTRVICIYL